MTLLWLLAMIAGFTVAVAGSRRAVTDATELSRGSRLPPFFIGMVLLALGTDLPEIANSIASSVAGHGDVNVGDSMGSAATQLLLVLGLIPFAGFLIPLGEPGSHLQRGQQRTAVITGLALVGAGLLMVDGRLGRADAVLLILAWLAGSRLVYGDLRSDPQLPLGRRAPHRGKLLVRLVGSLVMVAAGASLGVAGLVELADGWGVPEFVIAFFGASIGTSLPELIVVYTALRRGETALGVGDILGSSFADATLSLSAGPLLFPTEVDGGLALSGALVAAGAAALVVLLLGKGGVHTRRTGAVLLLAYAATWPILL